VDAVWIRFAGSLFLPHVSLRSRPHCHGWVARPSIARRPEQAFRRDILAALRIAPTTSSREESEWLARLSLPARPVVAIAIAVYGPCR